jgi:dTDP-glucose 4,6-dehydratase
MERRALPWSKSSRFLNVGEISRYAIDSSFAHRELKWRPLHDFREGLEATIDWYLNNRAWWQPLLERAGRY